MAAEHPPASRRVAGVRFQRGGRVVFVNAGDHDLSPGQLVFVEEAVESGARTPRQTARIATVVFGPRQLLEDEVGLAPTVRLIGIATDRDSIAAGRRLAAEADILSRAVAVCDQALLPARPVDAWLSPDEATISVLLDSAVERVSPLVRALEAELGLPVEVRALPGPSVISGPLGAGLPAPWIDWLAEPDAEPVVRHQDGPAGVTARAFIGRLFPPDEWVPRPRFRGGRSR